MDRWGRGAAHMRPWSRSIEPARPCFCSPDQGVTCARARVPNLAFASRRPGGRPEGRAVRVTSPGARAGTCAGVRPVAARNTAPHPPPRAAFSRAYVGQRRCVVCRCPAMPLATRQRKRRGKSPTGYGVATCRCPVHLRVRPALVPCRPAYLLDAARRYFLRCFCSLHRTIH